MLEGNRRRKLSKKCIIADIRMLHKNRGCPTIDIQIYDYVLSYIVVDGESGTNIRIEAIAHQLIKRARWMTCLLS